MGRCAEFRQRLKELCDTAEQMGGLVAEIERVFAEGREAVPGLVLAQSFVAADALAAELNRVAERLANGADPALLNQPGTAGTKRRR